MSILGVFMAGFFRVLLLKLIDYSKKGTLICIIFESYKPEIMVGYLHLGDERILGTFGSSEFLNWTNKKCSTLCREVNSSQGMGLSLEF